jgi:Ca-activated chloride channel family protein
MKKILIVILFLCVTSAAFAASKERSVKRGNAFYRKGDYAASLKSYQDALKEQPDSPAINFNLGTALYKDKKYDEAVDHLQKGLLGEDSVLQKNTHFNLGNALYQQGMTFGDGHIDQAIAALTESLRHFETVMNVDDKDSDAGYNHTIVQKELERLKKEKQQQKQNQQNKDRKQQDQKKDQQQQGSDKDQKQHDQNKEEQQKPGQSQEENSSSSKSGQQKQSSESSQKNNQDGQKNQDQQKPQQGFSQNQEAADKSQHDDKESAAQSMPGQMTKEEAKSLLKQFEQGQESAGLLNFGKRQSVERPVVKDW